MIEQETSTEIILNSDGSWKRVERMKYMEEKNIKKLWYVCTIIQNYCEAHNGCEFCPFHDRWNSCMIKNAAEVPTDELWKLFPEGITEEE